MTTKNIEKKLRDEILIKMYRSLVSSLAEGKVNRKQLLTFARKIGENGTDTIWIPENAR